MDCSSPFLMLYYVTSFFLQRFLGSYKVMTSVTHRSQDRLCRKAAEPTKRLCETMASKREGAVSVTFGSDAFGSRPKCSKHNLVFLYFFEFCDKTMATTILLILLLQLAYLPDDINYILKLIWHNFTAYNKTLLKKAILKFI